MIRWVMAREMRAAEARVPYGVDVYGGRDQVVYLSNVSWEDYERIDALRGEGSVPRLTYVEGVLELMSPGTPHESDKKMLARIFEAYLDHLGIPAEGVGSWTVKNKRKKLGAEADECYVFTTVPVGPSVKAPDLVIEVVYSSGDLDKLEVWRRLGAKEVWFWHRSMLEVFVRGGDDLVPARRSALVPAIDLELVVRCMHEATQTAAVRALRAALAAKPAKLRPDRRR
jgi:Uma2 family endonuclease